MKHRRPFLKRRMRLSRGKVGTECGDDGYARAGGVE